MSALVKQLIGAPIFLSPQPLKPLIHGLIWSGPVFRAVMCFLWVENYPMTSPLLGDEPRMELMRCTIRTSLVYVEGNETRARSALIGWSIRAG